MNNIDVRVSGKNKTISQFSSYSVPRRGDFIKIEECVYKIATVVWVQSSVILYVTEEI